MSELNRAHLELADTLRAILKLHGENELVRLVLDICEAGQLQPYQCGGIRWWRPSDDCSFASRAFALDNQIREAIASLFFEHMLVFSVEAGTPLDVRWKPLQGARLN